MQSGTRRQRQAASSEKDEPPVLIVGQSVCGPGSKRSLGLVAMVSSRGRWRLLRRCHSSSAAFAQPITGRLFRKLFSSVAFLPVAVTPAPPSGALHLANTTHDFHLRHQFTTRCVSAFLCPPVSSSSNLRLLTSAHCANSVPISSMRR